MVCFLDVCLFPLLCPILWNGYFFWLKTNSENSISCSHSQKTFALRLRTSFSEKRFSSNWLRRWLLILILFLFHTHTHSFSLTLYLYHCVPVLFSLILFFCQLTWNHLQILWIKSKFLVNFSTSKVNNTFWGIIPAYCNYEKCPISSCKAVWI